MLLGTDVEGVTVPNKITTHVIDKRLPVPSPKIDKHEGDVE